MSDTEKVDPINLEDPVGTEENSEVETEKSAETSGEQASEEVAESTREPGNETAPQVLSSVSGVEEEVKDEQEEAEKKEELEQEDASNSPEESEEENANNDLEEPEEEDASNDLGGPQEQDNEEKSGDEDKAEEEENSKLDADAENNSQDASEDSESTSSSEDQKITSSDPSSKDENVQHDLLERQVQYVMESDILNVPEFKEATAENKITALVNLLNSNTDTAMPMPASVQPHVQPQVAVQQVYENTTRGRTRPDLNGPMSPEERERYAQYLHGENKITEMHDIPPKSRLFIGNLPLKNVSKEDLFRIFSPYGHILQINIKNAFGFIQYNNPQSVRDAIQSESQEQNFGKKLILEISSSNARPQYDHGDHGTNSSSTFISSSKRPFQHEEDDAADMYNDNQGYKKSKRRVPACVIYVKRTADRNYANEVFNYFRRGTDLDTDMIFLKPRMELRRMINEVAHDGAWGVILVNKTRNVDIQTFYKGPQGETKFDEYVSISADDAVAIFNNLKPSRGSAAPVPMPAANPYVQPAPAIPQGSSSQGYYGGYGMPPMQQQAPPPSQQPYVQQGYGMPLSSQGYGAPPPAPMAQQYGRYQGSPPVMEPALNQPQLSSLLGANGGGQMNQQQLLAAIQNLPPNVVSNLLSMAQQQQQQQQPQNQQQLLGLLQSMQGQQSSQQQQTAYPAMGQPAPPMGDSYVQHQSMGSAQHQSGSPPPPPPQQQPQQPQQQPQSSPGNNVQSLLDSLAKLQK